MKVALSLTGTDGAARNLEAELPGWDFDAVRQASRDRWNELLGRIDVSGGTHEQQVKFYTDLFHVLCGRSMVSDADGRYMDNTWANGRVKRIPLHDGGEPEFAMYNYDALWLTQCDSTRVAIDLDPALLRGNAARWPGMRASASSEYSGFYSAAKVHDGVIGRQDGGDWASAGEQDPWIRLAWEEPIRADRIVLHDRPGIDDANGGTLTFSDGSTVAVSDVPPTREPKVVRFPLKTFDSVRFQVEGGSGPNVGLSEFEVYAVTSVPEAPTEVYADVRDGEATVSWRPPRSDGGAPVIEYVVSADRDGAIVDTVTTDAGTTQAVIGGLDPGGEHKLTVAARSLTGTGPAATASDASLLRGNAARWPRATVTASSEYDAWHAAANVADDGGGKWASRGEQEPWLQVAWEEPVRADRIVLRDRPGIDDANSGTLTFSDGTSVAVTGIPPGGAAYTVTFPLKVFDWVRFQVEGGTGPSVGLTELEVHAVPSVPQAPAGVSAVAGAGTASVSWSPPPFDGGARVTRYVVTPYRDGAALEPVTVDGDTTHVVVDELAAGVPYRFTVAAQNLMGSGPASAPTDAVTPQ